MKIFVPFFSVLLTCALQTGCATRTAAPVLYDFGPLPLAGGNNLPPASPAPQTPQTTPSPRLPALNVAEVQTPAWLDGPMMFYRLAYANVQQAYPYAGSRWSMTPAQLLGQRLKARIAQAGGSVVSPVDGAPQLPVLRIDADEFVQIFSAPDASVTLLHMRASVFQGTQLLGQRQFIREVNTLTPDAAGGARALANASDLVITDILNWIAEMRLPSPSSLSYR